MTAAALVADLRARGVTLSVDGDRLRCRPGAALGPDDVRTLRKLKPEVLAYLFSEQRPRREPVSCFACRGTRFWLSVYDVVVCGICHPPAAPELVAEWIATDIPRKEVQYD